MAPLGKKSAYVKNELAVGKVDECGVDVVPLPILSRLPLEIYTPGLGESLDESDETSDAPSLLPSSASQSPRVLYTRSRLPHISEQETALWRALHYFKPLRNDYASAFRLLSDSIVVPHPVPATHASSTTCPGFSSRAETYIPLIHRIFNWSILPALPLDHRARYYGVLFRSTRLAGSSTRSLYAADRDAHEEAVRSGGLLVYWYGYSNAQGDNVATCLWTSRGAARRASGLEMHRLAAGLASGVYERYELVRYCVRKVRGETQLRVEVWED